MGLSRTFSVDRLDVQLITRTPWFADLLRHWQPGGDAIQCADDPDRLRLTIRPGYLSFYRRGQSVGKVRLKGGALEGELHPKYIYGNDYCGPNKYVVITSEGIPDANGVRRPYAGTDQMKTWFANASKHVNPEKDFVDLFVAREPNTIDLELALPGATRGEQMDTSPRIDIVTLEPANDRWRIAFWEAKRTNDVRIRAKRGETPEVVAQLAQYADWLKLRESRESIIVAYHETCRLLVRLHAIARTLNPAIADLGPGIVATGAQDAEALLIDERPRLLIDNRENDPAFPKRLERLREPPCNFRIDVITEFDGHSVSA